MSTTAILEPGPREIPIRWLVAVGGIFLVSVTTIGIWLSSQPSTSGALAKLPSERRQAAYASSLKTYETLCVNSVPAGLEEFCHDQAQFLIQFPECDAHCNQLTTLPLRPVPHPR